MKTHEKNRSFGGNIMDFLTRLAVPGRLLAPLDVSKEMVVGGHLTIFTLMQSQFNLDMGKRFLFIEYHSGVSGEGLGDLEFSIDQLLYVLKENLPKGIIFGHIELTNMDGTQIQAKEVNDFCVKKLQKLELPLYYVDHFKNTIRFS